MKLTDEFKLTGVMNYVRGKNQTTNDNLYNIMPLNARLALVQNKGSWINSAEWQLVAAKTLVSEVRNENQTGGYGLLNLRSSYVWNLTHNQVRVDMSVENVFNHFYEQALGGAYVGQGKTMSANAIPWGISVPGIGRSFNVAVNVMF
jgi:iron complex outermembrane receptor protein